MYRHIFRETPQAGVFVKCVDRHVFLLFFKKTEIIKLHLGVCVNV